MFYENSNNKSDFKTFFISLSNVMEQRHNKDTANTQQIHHVN